MFLPIGPEAQLYLSFIIEAIETSPRIIDVFLPRESPKALHFHQFFLLEPDISFPVFVGY